jgi:hypothetical protein
MDCLGPKQGWSGKALIANKIISRSSTVDQSIDMSALSLAPRGFKANRRAFIIAL